jgi:uncharacterized iron-regulated membrane protein
VSAFGGDAQSDGGDAWTIDWDGKAKYWKQDAKVMMGEWMLLLWLLWLLLGCC